MSKEIRYFAGPLNLNRQTKEVSTVMGAKLVLSDKEFDALDMLISLEGSPITVEQFYMSVWDAGDGVNRRNSARVGLDYIMHHVNEAGEGFAHIEYSHEKGYTFLTNWERERQMNSNTSESVRIVGEKRSPFAEAKKKEQRRLKKALAGIGATAAVIAMVAIPMLNVSEGGGQFTIIDQQAPTAQSPVIYDINYPEINEVAVYVRANDATVQLFNPRGNTCRFTFEIILADTGETIYLSDIVAPGTHVKEVILTKNLLPGEYKGTLIIRSHAPVSLIEIDSKETEITLKVYS